MPPKVIESLKAWSRNVRPKQRSQSRAGVSWVRNTLPPSAKEVKRRTPGAYLTRYQLTAKTDDAQAEGARTEWVVDEVRKPCVGVAKEEQEPMALCQLIRFDGDEAECSVLLSGYEMPRVSLPAWALRAKKLKEGSRFIWIIKETGHISPADIDPDVSQATPQLSSAQQTELEDLYADSKRREAEGEDWTDFAGDGE